MNQKALTKLKKCKICGQDKPEAAFAWRFDAAKRVRVRSEVCAKCWRSQGGRHTPPKSKKPDEPFSGCGSQTGWRGEWPKAPEILDNKYWTATDTRWAAAEWAQRFWMGGNQ
ncbi:hypothetical protein [Neisseria lactamica]|uniref:hypothetical protein n=1 Tax=Neisseria lactamica TaxID=486 RepID=UPI0027E0E95F|nr:hypothetical protein [Neisseria lactamica]